MTKTKSDEPDTIRKREKSLRWWLLWTVGSVIGPGLGMLIVSLLMAVAFPIPEITFPSMGGLGSWPVPLSLPFLGLTLGFTQAILLQYHDPRRKYAWWSATTFIGWLAGNLVYGAIRAFSLPLVQCVLWGCKPYYDIAAISIPPAMAVAGIMTGILQLPILRFSKKQAVLWVAANGGGLYLGALITEFLLQLRPPTFYTSDQLMWLFIAPPNLFNLGFQVDVLHIFTVYIMANALVGFLAGMITGGILVWAFQNDDKAPSGHMV